MLINVDVTNIQNNLQKANNRELLNLLLCFTSVIWENK